MLLTLKVLAVNSNTTIHTIETLPQSIIAWNGPNIPHCNKLVKDTIDTMYGVGQWHFQRVSTASKLKFYNVPDAVDSLQNKHPLFCLIIIELWGESKLENRTLSVQWTLKCDPPPTTTTTTTRPPLSVHHRSHTNTIYATRGDRGRTSRIPPFSFYRLFHQFCLPY